MSLSFLVVLGLFTGPVFVYGVETCASDPAYKTIPATICITDNANYIANSGGVTTAEQTTIINTHNEFRSGVNPTASNMLKPVWDDNLAAFAQKWAQQCPNGHDTRDARKIRSNYNAITGQNVASSTYQTHGWEDAITMWFDEVHDFTYGRATDSYGNQDGNVVGHYTQVVYADAAKIGCGFALCEEAGNIYDRKYFVCNYILGNGMGPGSISYPYVTGTGTATCTANCGSHCINNLCDCGGKHCYNGGLLNLADCTCSCTYVWTGDQCLTKQCSPDEPSTCDPDADCDLTIGLPATCPFSCDICEPSEAMTCAAHPKCHESSTGCTYMGDQHTREKCATYGVLGDDHSACESQGGTWAGCEYCDLYSNIATDYCPKMCAICPE